MRSMIWSAVLVHLKGRAVALPDLDPVLQRGGELVEGAEHAAVLWMPVIHPCWSGSMPVLVENPAEAVVSLYKEAGGGVGLEDW
jgi:hypothetical protein